MEKALIVTVKIKTLHELGTYHNGFPQISLKAGAGGLKVLLQALLGVGGQLADNGREVAGPPGRQGPKAGGQVLPNIINLCNTINDEKWLKGR